MNLTAYRYASRLLRPAIHGYLWWLGRKDAAYRAGLDERWGRGDLSEVQTGSIWVHAASVGEIRAAEPLIDRLLADNWAVYLTTNTPAGRETAEAHYATDLRVGFPPADVPDAVDRFLDELKPAAALFVELELWPNRLAALASRGIPIALVNARLSASSLARYLRLGRLMGECLRGVTCVCAQTHEDAERLEKVGVPNQRLVVTGNLKFDQPIDERQVQAGEALRKRLGAGRVVWVAASVRQAEALAVAEAHARLRDQFPDALLIAVPRHPARFSWPRSSPSGWSETGRSGIGRSGTGTKSEARVRDSHVLNASRLTPDPALGADTAVLVVDTVGEMIKFLAAADAAFVGGTLTPVGGHNPLEPAALGKPVLMGPYVTNFRQIDQLLADCDARIRVDDAAGLADSLMTLFWDRHNLERIGMSARHLVEHHAGATDRTVAALQSDFLAPGSSAFKASRQVMCRHPEAR